MLLYITHHLDAIDSSVVSITNRPLQLVPCKQCTGYIKSLIFDPENVHPNGYKLLVFFKTYFDYFFATFPCGSGWNTTRKCICGNFHPQLHPGRMTPPGVAETGPHMTNNQWSIDCLNPRREHLRSDMVLLPPDPTTTRYMEYSIRSIWVPLARQTWRTSQRRNHHDMSQPGRPLRNMEGGARIARPS